MGSKPKKPKEKSNKKQLTTNEYVNVADVRGPYLYTKDGLIWQYLKVQPISTALMNDDEKADLTMRMTRDLSPLKVPFKILFLTRPTDVRRIIEYYENIKTNTVNPKRRENLTKTIRYFSGLSTGNGVLERQTFIALWSKPKQKEDDIAAKTLEFRNALLNCGVSCSICDETDILNMLGLFYNPVFTLGTEIDTTPRITIMEGVNLING